MIDVEEKSKRIEIVHWKWEDEYLLEECFWQNEISTSKTEDHCLVLRISISQLLLILIDAIVIENSDKDQNVSLTSSFEVA